MIRRNGYVAECDDAVDIEEILEFAEDFQFVTLGEIEKTRAAQINVELRGSFPRIALDADGSVWGENAVAVEV